VFVYGDASVFEMKPAKMLQRNLFSLGFSMLNLLELSRKYPHGILALPKGSLRLSMEIISREKLLIEGTKRNWPTMKQTLMKTLTLHCSLMKAEFSPLEYGPMRHKQSEVFKVNKPELMDSQMEEDLVLVEVQEENGGEIRSSHADYEYIRQQVM